MRNIVTTCLFVFITTLMYSQSISFTIVGLDEKDSKSEITFMVKSAELLNINNGSSTQPSNQKIAVTKGYNQFSKILKKAAKTGKVASSVQIVYKENGQTLYFNLTNVIIRNYNWKLEERTPMIESFDLYFQAIE